jgi:hypothetical protein
LQCFALPHTALWLCPCCLPQTKVGAFRAQECKEVLQQLGLPKSGNKPELVGRILTIFQDAATL